MMRCSPSIVYCIVVCCKLSYSTSKRCRMSAQHLAVITMTVITISTIRSVVFSPQMDKFQNQSALELVRQHIDHGGFHGYGADRKWHSVPNIAYVLTANHKFSSRLSQPPSRRLTRHFAMIACHQPV